MKNILKQIGLFLMFMMIVFSIQAKVRKTVLIIVDGIPTDVIERLQVPVVFDIAKNGSFGYCYVGGAVGEYTQTPTISAVGYNTILTGTWVNKHNVYGNSNMKPDYNYWSIFRIAKEQKQKKTTAIFSGWTDNRTVLLGYKKPETNYMDIDYIYDGYDNDTINYPHKDKDLHVFDYDETVSLNAAACIKENAPDFSWVYLWYTDDASHIAGNGKYFDEYVMKAGKQIERVWEAVKYREAHFDEEWLVILTTDHGRTENGYSHGGQSARERRTWVAMNKLGNNRLLEGRCASVDIVPTICRFMNFNVPQLVRWEQDGIPIIGKIEIDNLSVSNYDKLLTLRWNCYSYQARAHLFVAISNSYQATGSEKWIDLGIIDLKNKEKVIDMSLLPQSKFYKFVLSNDNGSINCWYKKSK